MTNDHPMQPTPEQIREWSMHPGDYLTADAFWAHIARSAYAAGADAQLELCCEIRRALERLAELEGEP